MTIEASETKLKAFLKRLEESHGKQEHKLASGTAHADPAIQELLFSFFLWESSQAKAEQAMRRVTEAVVDYNELRICMLDDLIELLSSRYPRAEERSLRLLATLNDLFKREHEVSLLRIATMPKREARNFLLSLEGIPHFVASRVSLLCFGAHAFPLDERLCCILAGESVVPDDAVLDEATSWMERTVRAGDALQAYKLLEIHAESDPAQSRAKGQQSPSKQKKTAKTSPKKPATSDTTSSKDLESTNVTEQEKSPSQRTKSG